MAHFNTILNQLLNLLPYHQCNVIVNKYNGDKWQKKMSTQALLTILLFAQITGKDSLRDLEISFNTKKNLFYHLRLCTVAKSTISYKNKNTDYRIFEEIFKHLLEKVHQTTSSCKRKFRFNKKVYSLDSTTIDLCLESFPWATFRKRKGAIKIHTGINNTFKTTFPEVATIHEAKIHDVKFAYELSEKLPSESIICFDKAYIDFDFLQYLTDTNKFFVTRAKRNMRYRAVREHRNTFGYAGILKDDIIRLDGINTCKKYKEDLRYIVYYDDEKDKQYEYITNNMQLSGSSIAKIYKARWDIELFFKWIKQNLKIKTFFGTSKNAVMTQIWVAMIYYLLLAYVKFQGKYSYSLLELSRIIKTTVLDKINLIDLMSLNSENYRKLAFDEAQQHLF